MAPMSAPVLMVFATHGAEYLFVNRHRQKGLDRPPKKHGGGEWYPKDDQCDNRPRKDSSYCIERVVDTTRMPGILG